MGHGKERPVTIKALAGGGFEMLEAKQPKKRLEFYKKKDNLKKEDWHEVVFELDDPGGTRRFHPDPTQAIWVARGDITTEPECPPNPSQDPLGEFKGVDVSRDGRRLIVHNTNETECLLSFRLNFSRVGDPSSDPTIIDYHDPGVKNGNGSV